MSFSVHSFNVAIVTIFTAGASLYLVYSFLLRKHVWFTKQRSIPAVKPEISAMNGDTPRRSNRYFMMMVGLFLAVPTFVIWQFGGPEALFGENYKSILGVLFAVVLAWMYGEWSRPGISAQFTRHAFGPPLRRFLSLTLVTVTIWYVGLRWYEIDYAAFLREDQTPLSISIVGIAFIGWLQGVSQAFLCAVRLRQFHALEKMVLEGEQVDISKIVERAKKRITVVGDYILKVHASSKAGHRMHQSQILIANLEDRLMQTVHLSTLLARVIPMIGLVGTIIGMKIGMIGMRATTEDISYFATAAQTFVGGIDTALNTTLIGSVLGGVYFSLQSKILLGGAVLLKCEVTDFVELTMINQMPHRQDS